MPNLSISSEKVCFLIVKAREQAPPGSLPEWLEIPKPKIESKNGRTFAYYPVPEEWGIDKQFQQQVRDYLKPGTSALFLVIEKVTPDKATAALQLASGAFILLFAFVFLWAGWEFTRFAWNRVSELADLPLWMIHVAWPVTGLTWFVFQSERMWDAAMVLAGRAQPKAEAKHLEAAE